MDKIVVEPMLLKMPGHSSLFVQLFNYFLNINILGYCHYIYFAQFVLSFAISICMLSSSLKNRETERGRGCS